MTFRLYYKSTMRKIDIGNSLENNPIEESSNKKNDLFETIDTTTAKSKNTQKAISTKNENLICPVNGSKLIGNIEQRTLVLN